MGVLTVNKKAYFNYFISDELECGIELQGSEVKSIREGHISIAESFVMLKNDEIFLKNAYIKPYLNAGSFIPDSRRDRKLLLHKHEIEKFAKKLQVQGTTLVPLKVYLKGNRVKIQIGLGKGKKLYDKRETLKQKTLKREMAKKSYI